MALNHCPVLEMPKLPILFPFQYSEWLSLRIVKSFSFLSLGFFTAFGFFFYLFPGKEVAYTVSHVSIILINVASLFFFFPLTTALDSLCKGSVATNPTKLDF